MTEPDVPAPDAGGKSSRRRRAGVIGAVLGVAAAGVAAGVATERLILRRARMAENDLTGEPFGRLPFDESLTVPTPDGIDLYVEIVEPADGVDLQPGFPPPGGSGSVRERVNSHVRDREAAPSVKEPGVRF